MCLFYLKFYFRTISSNNDSRHGVINSMRESKARWGTDDVMEIHSPQFRKANRSMETLYNDFGLDSIFMGTLFRNPGCSHICNGLSIAIMPILIFCTKYPEKLNNVMKWNTAIVLYMESQGSHVPYKGVILRFFLILNKGNSLNGFFCV